MGKLFNEGLCPQAIVFSLNNFANQIASVLVFVIVTCFFLPERRWGFKPLVSLMQQSVLQVYLCSKIGYKKIEVF